MTKNNHVLAHYDKKGNFEIIGKPMSYDDARTGLLEILEKGSDEFDRVALINLRTGVRKRRPVKSKKAPAKKAATKKAQS